MINKNTIQLAHFIIALLGLFLITIQGAVVFKIIGVIMIIPSLMFIAFILMTLDYEFARDHYKKIFRIPD